MIIYEVNLTVDPEIADEYAVWLRPHIVHILELDGFLGAEWRRIARRWCCGR